MDFYEIKRDNEGKVKEISFIEDLKDDYVMKIVNKFDYAVHWFNCDYNLSNVEYITSYYINKYTGLYTRKKLEFVTEKLEEEVLEYMKDNRIKLIFK